ncbi:2-keto-4-pentenoate hydratase [Rhizobium sullae]|uniref:Hydratase n=1 Tax=Rhizobium sullae TaxID=50338 RepID=A0A2N0DEG4_RHISU|nr:fumarylacetoacetate hydrolase family protein [Rhizobium sullae]PKA44490.1 hydratase [Rhizobium sullae]
MTNVDDMAARLIISRQGGTPLPWQEALPGDHDEAYAVQDATLAPLGRIGGWKVGAKTPFAEPTCAPLPVSGLVTSGSRLGAGFRLRGVEVEVALRVRRALGGEDAVLPDRDLSHAFDAVFPVLEIVETRLDGWRESAPLSQLADLQSHGALVLGPVSSVAPFSMDFGNVVAELSFDGQPVAQTVAGNPAGSLWRLIRWLMNHCAERRMPLEPGQIVTTGSFTGIVFAEAGTRVRARLAGIGEVEARFDLVHHT